MTVAHKNLTGTDLHEPKGVAAAAADKVYVSNGAGSGVWQKLTASQLTGTGNAFGAQLLHAREEQTSGVASSTLLTAATWTTMVLNILKTNEISGASLGSNTLSLPAGTYWIESYASFSLANGSGGVRLRLYNVTDAAVLADGLNMSCDSTLNAQPKNPSIHQRFTLAGTKTVALQGYSNTSLGGGPAMTIGTEVYSDLMIWKIA